MVKRISFSVPEWVNKDIINKSPYPNKSEWLQELIVKGFEVKQKESLWSAADPREKAVEQKPLKKTSLEARRASGPNLSLVWSFIPDFSSLTAQDRLLAASRC
jgi:hypothetical protein